MNKYNWENWKHGSNNNKKEIEHLEFIVGKPIEKWCSEEKRIVNKHICVLPEHQKANILGDLIDAGLRTCPIGELPW